MTPLYGLSLMPSARQVARWATRDGDLTVLPWAKHLTPEIRQRVKRDHVDRHEIEHGGAPKCPCGRTAHKEFRHDAHGKRIPSAFRCDKCKL